MGNTMCEINVIFVLSSCNYVYIDGCFLVIPSWQLHVRVGGGTQVRGVHKFGIDSEDI